MGLYCEPIHCPGVWSVLLANSIIVPHNSTYCGEKHNSTVIDNRDSMYYDMFTGPDIHFFQWRRIYETLDF